jgi:hypothetical protein
MPRQHSKQPKPPKPPKKKLNPFRAFPRKLLRDPRYQKLPSDARLLLYSWRLDVSDSLGIFPWSPEVAMDVTGLSRDAMMRAAVALQVTTPPWMIERGGLCWLPGTIEDDPFFSWNNSKHVLGLRHALSGYPDDAPIVRAIFRHFPVLLAPADPADETATSATGDRLSHTLSPALLGIGYAIQGRRRGRGERRKESPPTPPTPFSRSTGSNSGTPTAPRRPAERGGHPESLASVLQRAAQRGVGFTGPALDGAAP